MATAGPAAAPPPVEETLAWEAQWAPRAAAAAIAAGVLTLAGGLVSGLTLRDQPTVRLARGLRDAANPNNPHGLLEPKTLFQNNHAAAILTGAALSAAAVMLTGLALVYLFRAIRARLRASGQGTLVALAIGAVGGSVGILGAQIALSISAANFASAADHSTYAAHRAATPPVVAAAGLVAIAGALALAIGIVLVSLNGMRVGLLTRFMGILGVIAGVLSIVPLLPLPVVQVVWLIALGLLFLGKNPNGIPPAWETGRAEPWPTRQEMLEQQGRAPAPAKTPLPPVADTLPEAPTASAHPRSKKKKGRR